MAIQFAYLAVHPLYALNYYYGKIEGKQIRKKERDGRGSDNDRKKQYSISRTMPVAVQNVAISGRDR